MGLLKTIFIGGILSLNGKCFAFSPQPTETVVLLHGIINRPFMMYKIKKALEKNGFRVLNWGYKSTQKSIEDHAKDLQRFVENEKIEGQIHFVGFSLGAIIARCYLVTAPPPHVGRFVQIAPPNHGSPVVNHYDHFPPFRWIYGDKAIQQLRDGGDFLKSLGVPSCEWGIIVGGTGTSQGPSRQILGDNDGSVGLESSLVPESKDWVQIKSQHTGLLFKKEVGLQLVSFLKNGVFFKKETATTRDVSFFRCNPSGYETPDQFLRRGQ